MDRVIVYPGQIPLETDLLQTNKNAMLGLAKLTSTVLGTSAIAGGFACTPHGSTLSVDVGPGAMFNQLAIDATDYSSIDADATHQVMKEGHTLDSVTLSTPAPGTVGQSINYLIQAKLEEVDSTSVVLPYYNAGDPTHGYSGPNDTGTSQETSRSMVVTISAKAGTAAATGSQPTPSADADFYPLWTVTVPYGATSIISGNIVRAPSTILLKHTLGELDLTTTDIQEFSASGTWTKPTNAALSIVEIWGGGGGGGGGGLENGSVGASSSGGGGGGGGGYSKKQFSTLDLSATVSIVIGAGGLLGAGASGTGNTNGSGGSAGGQSTFGTYLFANGGGGGGGGRADAESSGIDSPGGTAGGVDTRADFSESGSAGGLGKVSTASTSGSSTHYSGAGGGGGGRHVNSGGGNAGATGGSSDNGTAGTAGASTSPAGAGGQGGTTAGGGGGGGDPVITSNTSTTPAIGGAGGAGGVHGGGGGGGGAGSAAATGPVSGTSGAGGAGADGFVRVTTIRQLA